MLDLIRRSPERDGVPECSVQGILIVSETATGATMARMLAEMGQRAERVDSLDAARERLRDAGPAAPDLLLLDLEGDPETGLANFADWHLEQPELPVIAYAAEPEDGLIDRVIDAGAADFVVLPVRPARLKLAIMNTLRLNALSGQVSRLRRRQDGEMAFQDLVGGSPAMRHVGDLAMRAAASNISVLIEGESGVGKEMVARAIQGSSERAGKPFVAVNCGAIPEHLVESILFGHERGAFTGANQRHIGKFQEADGGTLFLDEIGELKPDIQVKLLRALQEGEIDSIGGKRPVKVDIRLISATNRNLAELVEAGSFREDLYYRLNVYPILVPPLRKRTEDIAPLVHHFVANFAASEHKAVLGVRDDAMRLLTAFEWPGNVRQLENMVYRAVVLADDETLGVSDFPQLMQMMGLEGDDQADAEPPAPLAPAAAPASAPPAGLVAAIEAGQVRKLDAIEAEVIRLALAHYDGQMSEVARRLGIGRSTLYRKVREHGLEAALSEA
jgi:DNA-binding NtrC family response regulator